MVPQMSNQAELSAPLCSDINRLGDFSLTKGGHNISVDFGCWPLSVASKLLNIGAQYFPG